MALSLNEIKIRAQQFVLNWKEKATSAREEADAQTFENDFFAIFGVPLKKIAVFEYKVKLPDGSNGYIDLFWKGYSAQIVYNNFPWPDVSEAQKAAVMQKAQAVLDARAQFPNSSLADLYDPNTMPPVLTKVHAALVSAVDKLYCKAAFPDDAACVAFLFELYGRKTDGLLTGKQKGGKR